MLISPFVAFFCCSILSALLVYDAYKLAAGTYEEPTYTSGVKQALGGLVRALAEGLGPLPSVGVAAVLVLATGAWSVIVFRRYRAVVRLDKEAARAALSVKPT